MANLLRLVFYGLFYLDLSSAAGVHVPEPRQPSATCVIPAKGDGSDDAPAITAAFRECGNGGHVVFSNTTYNINSVLNTTSLKNVQIDIWGNLVWSKDTSYWLSHSMPIGYQNQSTVWFLGGDNVTVQGFGRGTLDGNGQTWYDLVKGQSNYPRPLVYDTDRTFDRPMGLTIWNAKDSVFRGLRFVQSQMWTMTIMHSKNILMEDIYVNSTSHSGQPARNTDGADVMFTDNITMRRWTVSNGDDAISIKANSTNVLVEDCTFYKSLGLAFGSIGQYKDKFETIENVFARNITGHGARHAAYVKTWTGEQVDYPPNGGGGGLGYMKNISLQDMTIDGATEQPITFTQCTTFSGHTGDCNSSLFKISDFSVVNLKGTTASSQVTNLQCSKASGGCVNIRIANVDIEKTGDSGTKVTTYRCSNVASTVGFQCS